MFNPEFYQSKKKELKGILENFDKEVQGVREESAKENQKRWRDPVGDWFKGSSK